jgi:hypothetical protein
LRTSLNPKEDKYMKIRHGILLTLLAAVSVSPLCAQMNKQGGGMQMQGDSMGNCSQLTTDEQDFANQLSPTHKMMFCNKFTPSMRQSAMQMSGEMGSEGNLVTNDQAVEKVAKDNNMMMPTQPPVRQGGSCPVK